MRTSCGVGRAGAPPGYSSVTGVLSRVWKGGPRARRPRAARRPRRRSFNQRYGSAAVRWVGTGTRTRPDQGDEPNPLPREERLTSNIARTVR
ncbi:hypothetical protein GCM10027259_25610 [Micromonospora palomenae]